MPGGRSGGDKGGLLRLFGTHTAHPGSIGTHSSAVVAHFVLTGPTLAGADCQASQWLLAPATAALTVPPTAALGSLPFDVQQLSLQLPGKRMGFTKAHF